MKGLGHWLVRCFEWMLLGIAIGCLGTYAYETVHSRAQRRQELRPRGFGRAGSSACSMCRA
jgi:hypothetical protein